MLVIYTSYSIIDSENVTLFDAYTSMNPHVYYWLSDNGLFEFHLKSLDIVMCRLFQNVICLFYIALNNKEANKFSMRNSVQRPFN